MAIKAFQQSVKVLFEQNHTFDVPKYQRGYAWEDEAIEDFVEDMTRCLNARFAGAQRHHFFGGIVTVRRDISGSGRSNYEVIDGQQRLASFVMLIAVVVSSMQKILKDLTSKGTLKTDEQKAKTFLSSTVETLNALYLIYNDNVELEYVEVPKLTLSKADNEFFQKILAGEQTAPLRASHERILAAWAHLEAFIENKVLQSGSASEKAKRLRVLVNAVLAEDCTVIFMHTETRKEAHQIFQVLNDRGVHLTDGDLLRATTMECLETTSLLAMQNALADRWDSVLAYPPGDTDSYLRWYFASMEGKRPKSSNLADQFLEFRFKCKDETTVNKQGAQAILQEVKQIDAEFALLRTLGEGDWPYSDHSSVTSWDRERLRMLVTHLKHTNAMPLLLSLRRLDASKFAEAISALERFVFRYKTIGNAHVSPMTELYLRNAKKIRDSNNYSIKTLRTELAELIEKLVPDSVFEANLREVRYSPRGGNGYIRYLLITLEDYLKWYEKGAQGMPKCKDKTRVFDFSNTTLEHIYPESPETKDQDAELEKVKQTIGNLTIFGPEDNDKLANKPFPGKREALLKSSLQLNREVGANKKWRREHVEKRSDRLVAMALKIFVP